MLFQDMSSLNYLEQSSAKHSQDLNKSDCKIKPIFFFEKSQCTLIVLLLKDDP
jgi:hypothetical protein